MSKEHLDIEALEVRRHACFKAGLIGMDALVAIVFPTEAVREASLQVAAERLEKKKRKRSVTLDELYDSLSPAAQRA